MSQLEFAMLHAPIEAMAQVTRNSQKIIAKDTASIVTAAKALATAVAKETTGGKAATAPSSSGEEGKLDKSKAQTIKSLAALIKEVQGLKRKLEESERAASKQAKLCTARLNYLKQVDQLAAQNKAGHGDFEAMEEEEQGGQTAGSDESQRQSHPPPRKAARATRNVHEEMEVDAPHPISISLSAASPAMPAAKPAGEDIAEDFTVTPRMRLDRIFADHLLRTNRPLTAAKLLATHPAMPLLLDPDVFATARRIESSLLSRDCSKALAWCGENRSRLNKINSPLEFDLRLQEFLTLVQQAQPNKAIEYARKFLAPATITTVPIERTAQNGKAEGEMGGAVRNNSEGDDKKESDGAAAPATTMVADPARVQVLQEAMNLLIFFGFEAEDGGAGTGTGEANRMAAAAPRAWHKYRAYLSDRRFEQLVAEFKRTHLAIYGLPSSSALEYVLNIGLSAMKTSSCTCTHTQPPLHGELAHRQQRDQVGATMSDGHAATNATESSSGGSGTASSESESEASSAPPACPVCTYPLSCLAQSLPVAQRTHSRLRCRLTGALMDDKNPPMVLPNGYVYSRQALTQMAALNNDVVTCPRTKESFPFAQARIAYVL